MTIESHQETDDQIEARVTPLEPGAHDGQFDRPNIDELQQAERPDDYPVVKVCVVEPVQVDELPTRLGGLFSLALPQTTPPVATRVVNDDPRRKSVTLLALEGDVWLSGRSMGAESGVSGVNSPAFRLGANVPTTINTRSALFAVPVAGSPTITLSVIVEQWAR